jgi:predicted alpha/beta superfamily hydrolase
VSANDRSPLADTEVHFLRSEHVGDEFKIFVGHCGASDPTPPAVLYVGDANGMFASAVDIVRFMQLSAQLPPILVVGIGYRMGAVGETIQVRTRDFTPTSDASYTEIFPAQTMMGGAPRFLAFIRDELQPWVHARHRIEAVDSAFFGHSAGGLVRDVRAPHRTGHVPELRHREPVVVVGRRHDVRVRGALCGNARRPGGKSVLRGRRARGP